MPTTVLVTGGAGFIGSHVVRHLAARGDTVRVIDDLSTGIPAYLDGVAHELRVVSLEDQAAVSAAVDGAGSVVHLAARAGVPDSIADPLGTFRANVLWTVQLLEAARRAGVGRFVLASTNAVVGSYAGAFHEDLATHPLSPYGASKLAAEAYVQAFAASFGLTACALRFSNAYGGWALHKQSVVAAWVRAALAGETITIHGDGAQTRDFVHAADLAAGIAAALDAPAEVVAGEVFQLGTGVETSVATLAATLGETLGGPLRVRHAPPRVGDVLRNVSQVSKASSRLGWRPTTDLAAGLRATVEWFRSALDDPALAAIVPRAASGSE